MAERIHYAMYRWMLSVLYLDPVILKEGAPCEGSKDKAI